MREFTMGIKLDKIIAHIICPILFFLQFTIIITSSFPDQEPDHDHNIDYNKDTISFLPCFERYVMEPYFKQHNDSTDLSLENYTKHKIASSLDKTVSTLSVLELHLIGEGSHRRLSSSIRVSVQPHLLGDFSSQVCDLIFIERLPSGVFADPFELDHILQRGVFKDASVFGDINLELPSFLSNRSVVEIHLDAALNISVEKDMVKEFKVEIPIHARYPPLEENGYSTVKFSVPDLFLRCKTHEDSPSQTCLISYISGSDGLKVNDVKWSIPAGIDAHAGIVSVVTFTAALLSTILIAVASFGFTRMEPDTRSKQS